MNSPTTADLCDDFSDELQIAEPNFASFGAHTAFSGPIRTVRAFEDNSLVKAELQTLGQGRVLVVDGGGSLRCALLGGNLAKLAADNGWSGVVINGCVRDSLEIIECEVGVLALTTHPLKSRKRGAGEVGIAVRFAGVDFRDDDWIYVDEDGMVVSRRRL